MLVGESRLGGVDERESGATKGFMEMTTPSSVDDVLPRCLGVY